MLQITVPGGKLWDEVHEEFITTSTTTLQLEHSLISISKWESKYHKAFLNEHEQMSREETLYYVNCMILNHSFDPTVVYALTKENIDAINNYINDPMTATTISKIPGQSGSSPRRETLTSELLYYYMVALNIPFECQKWHLNRLLMLIEVCSAKNAPAKKMGKGATTKNYAALNRARRAKTHSRG